MIINGRHFWLKPAPQIRGRIGRGKRRAYAYLMIPRDQRMTREATERLAALKRHSSLGAGTIAARDLSFGEPVTFGFESKWAYRSSWL